MGIVPNYHRVYLELRDRILDGSYDTDVPMPGEQKLSRELDVSRGTVRRALALLEDEGLVSRRQRARTYATPLSFRAAHKKLNLDLLPHENNYLEIFPGEIDQRFEVVAASKELMKQFPGEKQIGRVVRV